MIKPLSWSEIDCFWKDKDKWYISYVLGLKEPPTPPMERGSAIHAYLFASEEERATMKAGWDKKYSPPEIRAHDKMAAHFDGLIPKGVFTHEVKCETEIVGVPTLGYWDGECANPKDPIIMEVKTGRLWTEKEAQEHGQIALYSAQWINRHADRGDKWDQVTYPSIWFLTYEGKSGRGQMYQFKVHPNKITQTAALVRKTRLAMGEYFDKRVASTRYENAPKH